MLQFDIPHRISVMLFLPIICLFCAASVWANDEAIQTDMLNLAHEDAAIRRNTLMTLAQTGDARIEGFLESYRLGSIYIWNDTIVLCEETIEDEDLNELAPLSHPLTREPIVIDGKQVVVAIDDLIEVSPSRQERRLATNAKFLVRLSSPDPKTRMSGAKKCGDPPGVVESLDRLKEISEKDPIKKIRHIAKESLLLIRLREADSVEELENRLSAARELGDMKSMRGLSQLEELVDELNKAAQEGKSINLTTRNVYWKAIQQIQSYQSFVGIIGNVFRGFSLGSVLILMALGLAITFGLMGVINMAHGELMMIGAYATFEVQKFVGHTPDNPANWYYVVALPIAFLSAAIVGYLIEHLVVRHLYRRPLESLLATWGVGLVLIQIVRIRYGDNIGVNAPTWARGGIEIIQDLIFPYSRCFIIILCALCVLSVYYLMQYSKLGLRMRATMQNRDMANSLGVNTQRVDRYTFALGSGIAGIAGCAWTLIGGVTPDMGQTNFIVDSFLVVVTGGVGELLGIIFSGLGIGVLTKVLEPMQIGSVVIGAIWAKILLLIFIVTFIQFKPAGLFAPKGRLGDV